MANIYNNKIFRSNALKNLYELDTDFKLFTVVNTSYWCYIICVVLCMCAFLCWAFLGVVNLSLDGKGILISAGSKPILISASHPGVVQAIYAKPNMQINKGDLLTKVENLYLATELKFAESAYLSKSKQYEQIKRSTATALNEIIRKFLSNHRLLLNNLSIESDHLASLRLLYEKKYRLFKKRYLTFEELDNAKNKYNNAAEKVGLFKQNVYENQLGCKTAINEITDAYTKVKKDFEQAEQLLEMERITYDEATNIRSDQAGIINSINIAIGDHIKPGSQLFTLLTKPLSADLEALIFINHTNGQKVLSGMPVMILADEANFNSDYRMGKIIQVSEYPATKNFVNSLIGNTSLVDDFFSRGVPYLVRVSIQDIKNKHNNSVQTASTIDHLEFIPGAMITAKIITRKIAPFRLIFKF